MKTRYENGALLKAAQRKGFDAGKVAELSQVSRNTALKALTGETSIYFNSIKAVAGALNVSLTEIFKEDRAVS